MQESLYYTVKHTISGPDIVCIDAWNGAYRSVIKALSQSGKILMEIWCYINVCLSAYYIKLENSRFFDQNGSRFILADFFRDFCGADLTVHPSFFCFFIHSAVENKSYLSWNIHGVWFWYRSRIFRFLYILHQEMATQVAEYILYMVLITNIWSIPVFFTQLYCRSGSGGRQHNGLKILVWLVKIM